MNENGTIRVMVTDHRYRSINDRIFGTIWYRYWPLLDGGVMQKGAQLVCGARG